MICHFFSSHSLLTHCYKYDAVSCLQQNADLGKRDLSEVFANTSYVANR